MKEQAGVTLVAICGSWVAISGAIWKVAERADQVVSPKGKQVTADWLESDNLGPLVGIWADVLAHSRPVGFRTAPGHLVIFQGMRN